MISPYRENCNYSSLGRVWLNIGAFLHIWEQRGMIKMKRKWSYAGLVPPGIPSPPLWEQPPLLGGFGNHLRLVIVVHQWGINSYSRDYLGKYVVAFQSQVCVIKSHCFLERLLLCMRAEMSLQKERPWTGAERSGCITCLGDEPPVWLHGCARIGQHLARVERSWQRRFHS